MSNRGIVVGLCLAPSQAAPMTNEQTVEAIAGRGLVGDRYYLGTGKYSGIPGWGANVTLIESEAIAAINRGHGTSFEASLFRRNIVTAGIKLDALLGREFRCGDAVLRGLRAFPPCMHLAWIIGDRKVLRYLAYCGGIGAEVVVGGSIRLQDDVSVDLTY